MRQLHVILLLILTFSLSLSTHIFAAPVAAGRVIISLGSVSGMRPSGTPRLLKRGDSIFSGDTIKTGADAKVQLRFTDNTLIALNQATELKIKDYRISSQTTKKIDQYMLAKNEPAASAQTIAAVQNSNDLKISTTAEANDKMLISIAKGGLRMVTGAISKSNPSAYQLETVVGSIGVRGTGLSVTSSEKETQIQVYKGNAYLRLLDLPTTINLGPDSGFRIVTVSGNPSNPVVILQTNLAEPGQTINTSKNTASESISNSPSNSGSTSNSKSFSNGGSASTLPNSNNSVVNNSTSLAINRG